MTWKGPVAVGGVGGSGTRVVAQILAEAGFYIGADLNEAFDNLWFTLLLKRPPWFIQESQRGGTEIIKAIKLFEKAMTMGLKDHADSQERAFVRQAAREICSYGRGMGADERQAETILASIVPESSGPVRWGWKEPNTHIFLDQLGQSIKDLRYIHVIRHGLDMAFSANQAQLVNWGPYFGVEVPADPARMPGASLEYWIRANRQAIAKGREILGERFLIVSFDDLCANPVRQISRLLGFLGISNEDGVLRRLTTIPRSPKSAGRHRGAGPSLFTREQIAAVRDLGFAVA
jgi:hypothetical protein